MKANSMIIAAGAAICALAHSSAESLYWYPADGSVEWSYTAPNWNTSRDGSGDAVSWVSGSDAFFPKGGDCPIAVTGEIEVNKINLDAKSFVVIDGPGTILLGGGS